MHEVSEWDTASAVSDDDVRGELAGIISNIAFQQAPRLRQLLEYLVHETLNGRAARIKGFTIAQEVFGRDDPEDAQTSTIVSVQARRLRRRLDEYYAGDGKNDPVRIQIPKGTYVPVFELAGVAQVAVGAGADEKSAGQGGAWIRAWRWQWVTLATAILATGVLLWALLAPRDNQTVLSNRIADPSTTAGIGKPAIAVLPFENATSDDSGSAIAAGLTEDIITNLAGLSSVDVIAISSVLAFSDSTRSLEEIGKTLEVSHFLRGSIRGIQAKLRITAQLYAVDTNRQVWAQSFDRQSVDELDLAKDLAIKVVEGMSISLQPNEQDWLSRGPKEHREAYILFKQAMNLANPPTNGPRLRLAMQGFEDIVEQEPAFAGGYAGQAYMHAFLAFFGHSQTPEQDIDRAIELAEKSIKRDPDFGLAYTALAFANLARRDFDKALAASWKAVELQPNDPYVNVYHGVLLAFNGEAEQGVPYARRALRLDPLSVRTPYLNILGTVLLQTGDYEAALEATVRNIERGGPESPANRANRAVLFALVGRHDEAIATFRLYEANLSGFDFEVWLRRSFRFKRDVEKIMRPLRELAAK